MELIDVCQGDIFIAGQVSWPWLLSTLRNRSPWSDQRVIASAVRSTFETSLDAGEVNGVASSIKLL